MISGKTILAGTAATFMMAGAAAAGSITFTDAFGVTSTNFSGVTLSVPQFDGSLGELQSIDFVLNGTVVGDAQAESLDAAPSEIQLDLGAEITASTAAISVVAVALPLASETFSASAYDGTIDFGGTSGVSFDSLSESDTDMRTLTGSEMDEFIGAGFVDVFIAANGSALATGPGNVVASFSTSAGADIEVTYNFGVIPVPAAFPLLLGGMGALYAIRRRTKTAA